MKQTAIVVSAFVFTLGAAFSLSHLKDFKNEKTDSPMVPQSLFWNTEDTGNKNEEASDLSCETINWKVSKDGEREVINDYLLIAETDEGRYDPEKAVDEFKSIMDDEFKSRMEDFSGESTGCDLTKIDTESSLKDHKIEDNTTFAERQWEEFRKIECAFYAMKKTETILCSAEIIPRDQLMECDKKFREQKIEEIINNLQLALEVLLAQGNEIANLWPLHKRLECLNEELADQRELMVNFLKTYSKFPSAFINAAQSR